MKRINNYKKCLICGKKFKVADWDSDRKYCSYECYWKSLSGNYIRRIIKICPNCKKQFKVIFSNRNQRCCSRQCVKQERLKQKKVKPEKELRGSLRKSRKRGSYKKCLNCGKVYYVYEYEKDDRKYCSRECYNQFVVKCQARWTGSYGNCLLCGKRIYVQKSLLGIKKYCSLKCKRIAGRRIRVSRKCPTCNKEFYTISRKFCCKECYYKSKIGKPLTKLAIKKMMITKKVNGTMMPKFNTPTSFEQKIIDIINKYELIFKYVGDGKQIVGYVNPDFVDTLNLNPPLIIETYAKHWHKSNYEQTRHKMLQIPKENVLFLKDEDINRKDWEIHCLGKVREFIRRR